MIVNSFNPNYYSNYQSNLSKSKSVAFSGNTDDNVVKINRGELPDIDSLLKDMKGSFNYKAKDVEAVVKALVKCAQDKDNKIANLEASLQQTQADLAKEKRNVQKAFDASEANSNRCVESLRAKDVQLAQKDEELQKMRAFVEKYKPMCSVKSIDELDTVTPEVAFQTLEDMAANRSKAAESLVEFLTTGKGQEEFLAQLERNNIFAKAREDKVDQMPSIKDKCEKLIGEQHLFAGFYPSSFILNSISEALKTSPDGELIMNPKVKEQVKANAMALLAPVADNKFYNTQLPQIEKYLDENLDKVSRFYGCLPRERKKIYDNNSSIYGKIEEVVVPGCTNLSGFNLTEGPNGRSFFRPYSMI